MNNDEERPARRELFGSALVGAAGGMLAVPLLQNSATAQDTARHHAKR